LYVGIPKKLIGGRITQPTSHFEAYKTKHSCVECGGRPIESIEKEQGHSCQREQLGWKAFPTIQKKNYHPKGTLDGEEIKEDNLKRHLGEFIDKRRLLKAISCMKCKFCISR